MDFQGEHRGNDNIEHQNSAGKETVVEQESRPVKLEIGLKSRAEKGVDYSGPENKDAVATERDAVVVCDGVGRNGGKVAEVVSKRLAKGLRDIPAHQINDRDLEEKIPNLFTEAIESLGQEGDLEDLDLQDAGTMVSAVKMWRDEFETKKASIASIGVGRVYIFNPENGLRQINTPDDLVSREIKDDEEAAKMRDKFDRVTNKYDLMTQKEIEIFEHRDYVARFLKAEGEDDKGSHENRPSVHTVSVEDGDLIIVTTDGVHDNLTKGEIVDIINQGSGGQDVSDRLIEAAAERSEQDNIRSRKDDMTAVVVRVKEDQ